MHHAIDKKDIHPLAIDLCSQLQKHGYQSFIVGGCIRDLLIGVSPKDWDICTDASPEDIAKMFPKTIPTGIKHGTITVCMGDGNENHFEVTTFRVDGDYIDGRRPEEVRFVKNINEDLARRDFTINAIAFDPISNNLVDPFAGIYDLKYETIRCVGDPNKRFREDGLRIMRAARFAAKLNYKIENETHGAMSQNIETLKMVSKERVSDELRKIIMTKDAAFGLLYLEDCGALGIACPSLNSSASIIYQDKCQGDLETRLAFMYHNHTINEIEKDLIDLKLSTKEIRRTVFLIKTLSKFYTFKEYSSPFAYRTFVAWIKNETPDTYEYTYDQFLELGRALDLPIDKLSFYDDDYVPSRKELAINGNDLMENGILPGPDMKKLLDKCYMKILEEPENNNREYLLQLAMEK